MKSSIIGFRRNGLPFHSFLFGSGDDDGGGDADTGDDGKTLSPLERSLAAAKNDAKVARDEFRPWKAVLRELGIRSVDDLRGQFSQKQEPIDVDKVRQEAQREADLKASARIALAEVKAAATKDFADPLDAVAYLKDQVEDLLGSDGQPDGKAIERELLRLLEAKPHYRKSGGGAGGGFDGGARGTASAPKGMDGWLRETSRKKQGR